MKKRLRQVLALSITLITVALFYYYLSTHGSLLHQLITTSPVTVVALLVLFGFWFGSLCLILHACLLICNIDLPAGENLLINAYSTFLNYFLPGQGGPVLRGLYLKARYKLPFRRYVFSTLVYYAFYAVVSVLLLIGGVRSWWQTLIGVIVVSAGAYFGGRLYARKHHFSSHGLHFNIDTLSYLLFATCLQAICQVAIYWVELSSISSGFTIGQVMSYAGAASFSIFVSITPGAVGIRESFLLFSQNLHHITSSVIVGANVLDRSTYILFLAIIFVVLLVIRGRSILSFKNETALAADLVKMEEAKREKTD